MSQAPNSDICGSPVYVLRSEYQLGGRLCCLEGNVPFSDMFPPKRMYFSALSWELQQTFVDAETLGES